MQITIFIAPGSRTDDEISRALKRFGFIDTETGVSMTEWGPGAEENVYTATFAYTATFEEGRDAMMSALHRTVWGFVEGL